MKYWRAPATGRINWARMYEGFIEPAPPVPELAMFPPVLIEEMASRLAHQSAAILARIQRGAAFPPVPIRATVRLVPTKQKEVIR